jgi:4-hydroxyphenylpyruvate dioxygenase
VDSDGEYSQLYTPTFADLFFFEIVERRSMPASAPNAPMRFAAQSRLSRQERTATKAACSA